MSSVIDFTPFEDLVQKRKSRDLLSLLKKNKNQIMKKLDSIRHSGEWLRRLSLFREGLKFFSHATILSIDELNPISTNNTEGLKLFWQARFLWSLGCRQFSLNIFSKISEHSLDESKILADVYFSNGEYQKAASIYMILRDHWKIYSSLSHSYFLISISLADCFAQLKMFENGKALLKEIETLLSTSNSETNSKHSPLLQGLIHQSLAELLCLEENFKSAFDEIQKASQFFSPTDSTLDYFFYLKWKAFILGKLNSITESHLYFEKAADLISKKEVRPEVKIDFLRLKAVIENNDHLVKVLMAYPGLNQQMLASLKSSLSSEKNPLPPEFLNPNAKFLIDLSSFEMIDLKSHERSYFLPKTFELLAWLTVCGTLGLSIYRAIELIWPNDPFSLFLNEKRLNQLVIQIQKKLEVQVIEINKILYIKDSPPISIQFSNLDYTNITKNRPSFLISKMSFKSSDLDSYYSLKSRSQRQTIIRLWLERKWIYQIKNGTNNEIHYNVVPI